MEEDVVDLPQQVAGRRGIRQRDVDLGELQPQPHGEPGQRERAHGSGPHPPGELTVRLVQVAAMQRQTGGGPHTRAPTSHSRPDGARRSPRAPSPRARRPRTTVRASIASKASSASLMTIDPLLPVDGRHAGRLRERGRPWSRSPTSRCASPESASAVSRQGLQSGSWSTASLARANISSMPSAHMTARSIARVDSSDDAPSDGTESDDAASTASAQRCASPGVATQRRDPGGEDRERRMRLHAGVADRREPPLDGRDLARPVGGDDQRRHQRRGIGPAPACRTGARAPAPVIRWPRTSRRRGGAASR